MGDLDDFFAKKDKKKGKTKIVAANLLDDMKKESEAKKEKQKKKKQLENIEQAPHVLKKTKEDDDWEDFEDPSGLNLEGLRVLNLAERQAQEAGRGADGEGGSGQDGEGGASVDEGPWRRKAAESAAAAAESAEADKEAATASTAAGATAPAAAAAATDSQAPSGGSGEGQPAPRAKYIPPQLRSAAAAVSGRPEAAGTDLFAARPLPRGSGRRDKNAPNINDVEEFPTLAPGCGGADDEDAATGRPAGRRPGQAEDSRPFESVREQSGRRSHPAHSQLSGSGGAGGSGSTKAEAVSVQNRWDALGQDAAS